MTKKNRTLAGEIPDTYANYFFDKRKELGMSAENVAENVGCSARSIRRLETGHDVSFKLTTLKKMSHLYDFDLKIIDDNQKNDIEVKTLTPSEMQIDIINRLNNLDIEQLMIINNLIAKMKELDKSKEDGDKANKSISNEAVKLIREITTLNLKQSTMLYDFVHVMIKENV